MNEQNPPELQKMALEEVCLSILGGQLSDTCSAFLGEAPQPPTSQAIMNALRILEDTGAVYCVSNEFGQSKREVITALGTHLAKLAVDVRLGKMLVYGCLFKCLDKVLTIVSFLSATKSPYETRIDVSNEISAIHHSFRHPSSDFLTFCNIWEAFKSSSNRKIFCSKTYMNRIVLEEILQTRKQLLLQLHSIGFASPYITIDTLPISALNKHGNKDSIVSAAIVAGLFPNCLQRKTEIDGSSKFFHKDEQVWFNNSSVYFSAKPYCNFLMFLEKMATDKTYISAATSTSTFSLMLFCRSIEITHASRQAVIDDWIKLDISPQLAVVFKEIRHVISIILETMVAHLESEACDRVLEGVINLLELEENLSHIRWPKTLLNPSAISEIS